MLRLKKGYNEAQIITSDQFWLLVEKNESTVSSGV